MARQMKDSGVEWIGEIPEAWSCSRVGRHYNIILGKMLCSTPCNDSYTYEPYYCAADVHFEGISKARKKMWFSEEEKNTLLVTTGDLLVTEGGTGGCAIVQDATTHAYIQNSLMIVRGRENASEPYLCYWLESLIKQSYLDYICNKVTIIHFTKEKLSGVPLPLPPEAEQQNIISYLDGKISLISKALEQTRATIEEYKKLKQALITEAVTKGVRGPRPMKPSGVEWIGDIPVEWNILKTLWLLEMPITDGPHETPDFYDEGIPFISAEAVSCGRGGIDFSHKRGYISKEYYDECCKKYTPRLHDIYMIKSGATTGRVSMVDTEEVFTIWSPLAVLRANQEKMLPRFLFYSLQADYYQKQISLSWSFGTQQNIGMRVLEQLKISTPDADEQQEIAAYLDTKCAEIDRIIEKKEQLIEELGSYKKSLIYEYVTGKKAVQA